MNKSTSWAQAVGKMTYNLHRRNRKTRMGVRAETCVFFWKIWLLILFNLVLLQIEKRTVNSGRSIKPKQTGKKSPKYKKNSSDHQVCNFAPPVSGRPHLSLGTSFAPSLLSASALGTSDSLAAAECGTRAKKKIQNRLVLVKCGIKNSKIHSRVLFAMARVFQNKNETLSLLRLTKKICLAQYFKFRRRQLTQKKTLKYE